MASLLNYGAGAYSGLEDIMDRDFKRQVEERLLAASQASQAEQTRHNQAQEGLQGRTLDQNGQLRADAQKSLDESRITNAANLKRDDIRARVGMMAPGDKVSPQQYEEDTSIGMVPAGRYKQTPGQYQPLPDEQQGPAQEPPPDFTFLGVPQKPPTGGGQTQTKSFHYKGKDIIGQETPTGRVIFQGQDITDDPSLRPYQAPDRMLVQTQGAGGETTFTPRGQAAGKQAPLPAAERQQVEGLDYLDSLVSETLKLGDQSGWAGVGPVKSLAGKLHDYTPIDLAGEGDAGKTLRAKIEQIRTESSFAQGGKNLTPTERAALDSFLATVGQDPTTAKLRLEEYQKEAQTKRRGILPTGTAQSPPGVAPPKRHRYDMNGNEIQ